MGRAGGGGGGYAGCGRTRSRAMGLLGVETLQMPPLIDRWGQDDEQMKG